MADTELAHPSWLDQELVRLKGVTIQSAAATGDPFRAGAVRDHLTKVQGQMVMLAEHYDFVIGGDPDRDTIDLAILQAGTSRVGDQTADRTDGPAYSRLLAWARQHAPGRRVWALEGTSSFAAGFVTMLAEGR